jgi:hypothetical protein
MENFCKSSSLLFRISFAVLGSSLAARSLEGRADVVCRAVVLDWILLVFAMITDGVDLEIPT